MPQCKTYSSLLAMIFRHLVRKEWMPSSKNWLRSDPKYPDEILTLLMFLNFFSAKECCRTDVYREYQPQEMVVGWGQIRAIRRMRQNFPAQFLDFLLCDFRSGRWSNFVENTLSCKHMYAYNILLSTKKQTLKQPTFPML